MGGPRARTRASVWRWRIGISVVIVSGVVGLVYAEVSGELADRRKVHGTFTSTGCIDRGRHGRTHYWDCIGTFTSNDGRVSSIVTLVDSTKNLGNGRRAGALLDTPDARHAREASQSVFRRWVTIGFASLLTVMLVGMWVSLLRADRGLPPARRDRGRMRGYRPIDPGQGR
jgi:hypothetical protein